MDWQTRYKDKEATLPNVVELIPKGKHIFIGSGAAEPVGVDYSLLFPTMSGIIQFSTQ